MCRGKLKGSFCCYGQWHSVPQWLQGSFAGTQGTGKHPRLREGHSLPHTMPPAPRYGMQACYFLLFYQREVTFVIRKNNRCHCRKSSFLHGFDYTAWLGPWELRSLWPERMRGPGDIWQEESRDRAADSRCVGFALCCLPSLLPPVFEETVRFLSDMSLNKYRRGLVWISLGSFPTLG